MNGPAKYGAIVYSKDIKKLSEFYLNFFDMVLLRETAEFISIDYDGFNIIIHIPPIELLDHNFNSVKLFLTVDCLEEAKRRVISFGGEAFEGQWSNPMFKVCNIADPEGNHIQIREFTRVT